MNTAAHSRAVIIASHGVADSKNGVMAALVPFVRAGYSLVLYDMRHHNESSGREWTWDQVERVSVDDIRAGNPPSNPELLDKLTNDFIASGFDTRKLIKEICESRTYQLSIIPNKWNEDDTINFSHASPRRLSAEQKAQEAAEQLEQAMQEAADGLDELAHDRVHHLVHRLDVSHRRRACQLRFQSAEVPFPGRFEFAIRIAAQHTAEPHTGIFMQDDITNDHRVRCDVMPLAHQCYSFVAQAVFHGGGCQSRCRSNPAS